MGSKKDKARATAKKAAREAAKRQSKRSKRGGSSTITPPDGIDFFKPIEEGSMTFDVIGFVVGKDRALLSDVDKDSVYYKVSYKKHGSVGPEEKHIVCPSSFKKRCPMEEEFQKQKKSGAEYDDYKSLRPSDRDLFIVHHNGKLYLWDVPWFWFGKILDIEIDEHDGDDLFWFPEDGLSVRATFETDSFGTKATAVRFKKRKDDIDDKILEQAGEIDLAACVNEVTYEDVERLMHGVGDEDDDGDEDTPEPEDKGQEPDEDDDGDQDSDGDEGSSDGDEDSGDGLPECFGKYDDDSDDCDDCGDRKDCKKDSGKSGKKDKDKKNEKSDKGKKDECPHGHKFGKDFDEEDDCDDCKNAKACEKANEG